MFTRLLILFIIVPLCDLLLLLGISKLTHWTTTVLIVILSGVLGAWLAKIQSNSVGGKIRSELSQNNIPSSLLTDGAMILFAAGLLITPGLITDLFGLTLLLPRTRAWYKTKALAYLKKHLKVQVTNMDSTGFQSDIVDGEVVSNSQQQEPEPATSEFLQ